MPLPEGQDRRITIKQRKWLAEYIKTGNATQSALKAYNCRPEVANQLGYENTLKLADVIKDVMDDSGITDTALVDALIEGLHADGAVKCGNKMYKVPAWDVRHKYLETALRLRGVLADRVKLDSKDLKAQVVYNILETVIDETGKEILKHTYPNALPEPDPNTPKN